MSTQRSQQKLTFLFLRYISVNIIIIIIIIINNYYYFD